MAFVLPLIANLMRQKKLAILSAFDTGESCVQNHLVNDFDVFGLVKILVHLDGRQRHSVRRHHVRRYGPDDVGRISSRFGASVCYVCYEQILIFWVRLAASDSPPA
jgi:hypothetical protein